MPQTVTPNENVLSMESRSSYPHTQGREKDEDDIPTSISWGPLKSTLSQQFQSGSLAIRPIIAWDIRD